MSSVLSGKPTVLGLPTVKLDFLELNGNLKESPRSQ